MDVTELLQDGPIEICEGRRLNIREEHGLCVETYHKTLDQWLIVSFLHGLDTEFNAIISAVEARYAPLVRAAEKVRYGDLECLAFYVEQLEAALKSLPREEEKQPCQIDCPAPGDPAGCHCVRMDQRRKL